MQEKKFAKKIPRDEQQEIEQKEKREVVPVKVLIFDSTVYGRALLQVLRLFKLTENTQLITDPKELLKGVETEKADAIIFNQCDDRAVKLITKLRNKPEIKNQPAVVAIDSLGFGKKDLRMMVNAGADVSISGPVQLP